MPIVPSSCRNSTNCLLHATTHLIARMFGHLEAAYTAMWDRYLAGLARDHLSIRP
jgi:hypothetical protein